MFWFNKHEPHTTYTDIRKETLKIKDRNLTREVVINPDMVEDFTKMKKPLILSMKTGGKVFMILAKKSILYLKLTLTL